MDEEDFVVKNCPMCGSNKVRRTAERGKHCSTTFIAHVKCLQRKCGVRLSVRTEKTTHDQALRNAVVRWNRRDG
jgi:hypothetical protein